MSIYLYLKDFAALDRPPQTGMEKAVAGLAHGLAQNGATAVILCESDADRTVRQGGAAAPWSLRCFQNNAKRKYLHIAQSLRDFIDEQIKPTDLVILNGMFHPSVFRVARQLRRRGITYIAFPHDPYHQSIFIKNIKMKLPYWYLFERPMLRRAAAIHVLDARHGDLIRDRGIKTPILEIANGFDSATVPAESSLSWSADAPPRLLFLGRMESLNKGLDLLIDAMSLPGPHSQAHLTLQGPDGGDLAALKQRAAAANLADRITFAAPDFSQSSSAIAAKYDVLVLPSRFEGFSMAAMEAMLAARPIVISSIAGLAPHVRRASAGIVVDATSQSIAAGLDQIIAKRPHWRDMGFSGRRYVLENLDWKTIAAKALADYRALLPSFNAA